MAEVRYVFGNLMTGEILEEIPLQGVVLNDSLEGGDFQGTCGLDQSGRRNEDIVAATIPGRCYLVVERAGSPVWCGIVWSRTYQSQAKSMQIFAKTMNQYASRRNILVALEYIDIEQRNIFRDLWLQMTADPNTPPFVIPGSYSETTAIKSLSVEASELKRYGTAMDELAATTDGFEWRVSVVRASGAYNFVVTAGSPQLGMPLGSTSVVFEYPGNILNYWKNDTIGTSGTHILGVGSGEGDTMPVVEVIHSDLLAGGFPRYDYDIAFKDISDLDQLETLTTNQATLRKAPMPVYTVEMSASATPDFSEWGLGDGCKLVLKDPMHPDGSVYSTRIKKYEYRPPSGEGVEEVRLTFEGDEGE